MVDGGVREFYIGDDDDRDLSEVAPKDEGATDDDRFCPGHGNHPGRDPQDFEPLLNELQSWQLRAVQHFHCMEHAFE